MSNKRKNDKSEMLWSQKYFYHSNIQNIIYIHSSNACHSMDNSESQVCIKKHVRHGPSQLQNQKQNVFSKFFSPLQFPQPINFNLYYGIIQVVIVKVMESFVSLLEKTDIKKISTLTKRQKHTLGILGSQYFCPSNACISL